MLRRHLLVRPRPAICQICESLAFRQGSAAKRAFGTLTATKARSKTPRFPRSTAQLSAQQPALPFQRTLSTIKGSAAETPRQDTPKSNRAELESLVSTLGRVKTTFLAQDGIPTEAATAEALRVCAVSANLIAVLRNPEPVADTAASTLLDLDANGRPAPRNASPEKSSASRRLKQAIDDISETAYSIISEPRVFITPQLLEQYVNIHARLGRPQTLPHVLQLYATKPLPRGSAGSITFVPQNPNKTSNAVEPRISEVALDAAIEAKNMDAAVAIIEKTYATKAFIRARMIKKGLIPAATFAALPFATYTLATNFSHLQNTMDEATATSIAYAGILAYVGFTGAIGLVAVMTANDHVKRVSWAPGTPLRSRFLREDERAALDKVACAFGFSEPHRFGEEEGADFHALREYVLRKGMILDQVALMEGLGA